MKKINNGMRPSKAQERQKELLEFFNEHKDNKCKLTDAELTEMFGYTNRKTLQRDLKALEENRYIDIRSKVLTPSHVGNGQATQYIRKVRTIYFQSSDNGIIPMAPKIDQLSHCNNPFYSRSNHKDYLDNQQWYVKHDTMIHK